MRKSWTVCRDENLRGSRGCTRICSAGNCSTDSSRSTLSSKDRKKSAKVFIKNKKSSEWSSFIYIAKHVFSDEMTENIAEKSHGYLSKRPDVHRDSFHGKRTGRCIDLGSKHRRVGPPSLRATRTISHITCAHKKQEDGRREECKINRSSGCHT